MRRSFQATTNRRRPRIKSGLRREAPWRCSGGANLRVERSRNRKSGNARHYPEKVPVAQHQFASGSTDGLAMLIWSAGLAAPNLVEKELEVHFPFPGRPRDICLVRLVHHRDDSTSTVN